MTKRPKLHLHSRVEQIASVRPGSDFKVIVCQDSRQSDCVITAAEDLPGSGREAWHRW